MFKAEFLDGEFRNPGPLPVMAKLSGSNLGVQLNAGYRADVTENMFIEPVATLSYVGTSLDSTSVYSGTVGFDDATSLRGRLGVQFGLDWMSDDTTIRPFGALSYWHEFEGDNVTTLTSGGLPWSITDSAVDGWWQFGLGLELANANGFSGFVRGDYSITTPFESDPEYSVTAVRVGMRWSFGG